MLEIGSEHAKGALLGILYLTKHAKAKPDSIVIAFAQLSGLAATQDPAIYYQVMADVLERSRRHG